MLAIFFAGIIVLSMPAMAYSGGEVSTTSEQSAPVGSSFDEQYHAGSDRLVTEESTQTLVALSPSDREAFNRLLGHADTATDNVSTVEETTTESLDPTMNGTVVDPAGKPIPGAQIEVLDQGGSVVAQGVSFEGRWAVALEPGTYDVITTVGDTSVERQVQHDDDGSDVVQTTDLCEDEPIVYTPQNPEIGEPVTFQACESGEDVQWDLDDLESSSDSDGSSSEPVTPSGEIVTHTYEEPGTYDVEVTVDGETFTREVEIDDSLISITAVSQTYYGPSFSGFDINNTYAVSVDGENDIEDVYVEVGDEEVSLSESDDGYWVAEVNLNKLDESKPIEFVAEDTEGNVATDTEYVSVVDLEWLAWFFDSLPVSNVETSGYAGKNDFNLTVDPDDIDVVSNIAPWRKDAEFELNAAFGVGILAPDGTVDIATEGGVSTSAVGWQGTGGLGGSVQLDDELQIDAMSAFLFLTISRDLWSTQVGVGDVDAIDVNVTAEGDFRLEVDEATFNEENVATDEPPLQFGGDFTPTFTLSGSAASGTDGLSGEAGVEGSVSGPIGFEAPTAPGNPPTATGIAPFTSAALEILVQGYGEVEVLFYEQDVQVEIVDETIELVDLESTDIEQFAEPETTTTGWEVRSKHGEPPAESVESVDSPLTQDKTADVLEENTITDVDRLTHSGLTDTHPAVAQFDTDLAVVWSSQDEEKSVEEGRDLVMRTKSDGQWDDTVHITDDNKHDEEPALASTDDELVAAWSRLDVVVPESNITDPNEAAPHQEIAFSRYDGSNWSSVELLTDSESLEYQPSIATAGDTTLVAWEQNAANDRSQFDDRSVRYALLEGTNTVEEGTIDNAARPDVGVSDTGEFDIAYFEPDNDSTESGTVAHGQLTTDGDYTTLSRTDTHNFSDVSTDGGEHAWAADTALWHDDGEGATELDLSVSALDINEVTLESEDEDTLLSYRMRPEGQQSTDIVYRVASDGEWVADQRVAGGEDTNLTLLHSDAVLDTSEEEFTLSYAANTFSQTDSTRPDVFTTTRAFDPTYTISADAPSNVAAGEPLTVNYTVENVGEIDGSDTIPVELWDGNDKVKTDEVGPIDRNGAVTGEFETTAPDDGVIELSLDIDSEDQDEWLETNVTLQTGTPLLGLTEIDTDRTDTDSMTVNTTIENRGTADATDVPVAVSDGTQTIATDTVDHIPQNGSVTTAPTVESEAINTSVQDRVTIDPEGTLDDEQIEQPSLPTWLLQPDLSVHTPIAYQQGPDGVTVTTRLENYGDAEAETTLTATDAETGEHLGQTTTTVPAAIDSDVTTDTVTVPLETVTEDDEGNRDIQLTAETPVRSSDLSDTAVEDTVGPILPATGSLNATVVDDATGEPIENASVLVDGQGSSTDKNGSVELTALADNSTVTAEAEGYSSTTASATVSLDETTETEIRLDSETPSLETYADDDGIVDTDGLLEAIDDFRDDRIDISFLLEVIEAFRSGDPVV